MIRRYWCRTGSNTSKPRASGDDPDYEPGPWTITYVNPARAGMIHN